MKSFRKTAAIAALVVVAVVVSLLVLAKVLITPERVKSTVVPVAEKYLQRHVELGRIEVSLFSGISLENLTVADREGTDPFVSTRKAVLNYQLWPLLFGRVVVDKVTLEQPHIRIVRLADGGFNFSDLLPEKQPSSAAPDVTEAGAEASIDLLISTVRLDGGEVVFFDHTIGDGPPFRFLVSGLTFIARDLSLQRPFPFELGALLNGGSLQAAGELNLQTLEGKARVDLADFDLIPVSPYYQQHLPGRLGSLRFGLSTTATVTPHHVAARGTATLKDLDLVLDAFAEAPIRAAEASLDFDTAIDLDQSSLKFDKAVLNYDNLLTLQVTGRVDSYSTAPQLDLQVDVPAFEVRPLIDATPPALTKSFAAFDPAGALSAKIRLAGPVDAPLNLLREGSIQLEGLQANLGKLRPALNGALRLQGDRLTSDGLTLRAGDNQATIEFTASSLFKMPIIASHRIVSDRFLLEPLLQVMAAEAGPANAPTEQKTAAPASEIGPIKIPIRLDGRVEIAETLYRGLQMSNFRFQYRLIDNVVTIDELKGEVAGGAFRSSGRIDLARKGLDYQGQVRIEQLQADPVVSAFFPKAKQTVYGNLSLLADFKGRGTLPDAVRKNLSAQGEWTLADGRLTGPGFVRNLADYLKLDQLRDIEFNRFQSKFSIIDGKAQVAGDLTGNKVRMSPRGTVGLDGTLDLALQARVAPEVASKIDRSGSVTQFLNDQDGWTRLPLKVVGTFGQPVFTFDTSAVREQVRERAQEEARKVIEKILPGESGTGPEAGKSPVKESLKETLKGILGQ